ncbi:MAG: hypothetical protein OXI32_01315 [bacterium]|nr:hypothetical protein [bacterium]
MPAWFQRMPVSSHLPNDAALVVEHQITYSSGTELVHQQIFDEVQLIAWVPGRAKQTADLILARSAECDAGDLLGRLSPTEVALATSITVGGRTTDLYGVGSVSRPGLSAHTTGTVEVCLDALNTPFGDARATVRLNPDGTQQVVSSLQDDCDLTIYAEWSDLMTWIHADTILGYLMTENRLRTDGAVILLSYVEGHMCWPKSPQEEQWFAQFHQVMKTYQRLRLSPAYQDLMDAIEEADSQLNPSTS